MSQETRNAYGEIQFTAEKKSPTEWKMDFSNAKCPALESKYAK